MKNTKKKTEEHKQVQKAKLKAQHIKAKAHEAKEIDKKVNEQRDATKDDLDKVQQRTETAIDSIMSDARDTIEKMKASQPGFEPKKTASEQPMSKQAQSMHEEFEALKK